MEYNEIEQYFENNQIDELLMKYKVCFDDVDYHENLLINHVLNDINSVREAIQRLSGLYMSLRRPFAIAETAVENGKSRHYHTLKIQQETTAPDKKLISASLEREASLLVAPFRRARNLFEAYLASCEKAIGSCQSLLSSLKVEKGLPQGIDR